jgi:hypothetical protein
MRLLFLLVSQTKTSIGHHFRIEDVDDGHLKQDCGIEAEFDQSGHASHPDENLIEGKLGYVGKI